jgi:leucyl/phenylalanyl-tRNA--protein transferase
VAFQSGPDPHFPYLSEDDYYQFPPPNEWDGDIVAVGGNLSPGMLLSAYEQGVFPWYNPGDPVIWQSPDPRCVIFPENLHVSSSMRKIFKSGLFRITIDEDFQGVIKGCADIQRPGQGGTWISDDIIKAYTELHRLGWAHSAEAWQDGELAGGCYGIIISDVFFGESMFSRKRNASKAAFLSIAEKMFEDGSPFIDCQIPTPHLMSMGGEILPRQKFISMLKKIFHSRVRNG